MRELYPPERRVPSQDRCHGRNLLAVPTVLPALALACSVRLAVLGTERLSAHPAAAETSVGTFRVLAPRHLAVRNRQGGNPSLKW